MASAILPRVIILNVTMLIVMAPCDILKYKNFNNKFEETLAKQKKSSNHQMLQASYTNMMFFKASSIHFEYHLDLETCA
jgi:hypothetical protein